MISCNEFILIYNAIFKELDKDYGKEEVIKLWGFLSDTYCNKIEELIKKAGLKGMYEYWSKTLKEEGGRYHITLTDDEFIIDMHYCPSVGKLLNTHVEPYKDYCGHCPALYKPIIEKYGFKVNFLIDQEKAECRMHVRVPQ